MIKAIFFDWFNTVAHYDPPREELHSHACHEFGVEVSPDALIPGLLAADKFFFEENTDSQIGKRSQKEQTEIYYRYQVILLTEAGVKTNEELVLKIMDRVRHLFKEVRFVLFDDVVPTMKALKERNLILGLLTNATKDMISVYRELGLEPYIDVVVTSEEAGNDKPKPPIFLAALELAGVNASEAIHVGDQYQVDIIGARGVGISPILLDRHDFYPEVTDCPRIHTLPEVVEHI